MLTAAKTQSSCIYSTAQDLLLEDERCLRVGGAYLRPCEWGGHLVVLARSQALSASPQPRPSIFNEKVFFGSWIICYPRFRT